MDDLDRMFRRLVQNVRNGYPEYLTHPFEVSELYQNLIPYRHNRRELEIETNQDYEVALCRLLTGERGYLVVDDSLAESIRRELSAPNPNTAVFREFAASRVQLPPDAQRRWQQMGGDLAPAADAGAPTGEMPPASPPPPPPPWSGRPSTGATIAEAAPPPPPEPPPVRSTTSSFAIDPESASEERPASCRYCGGSLPIGRQASFCPHCGQNLTIQRCPACGTEMELHWKFCITCGRGVTAP